MWLFRFLVIFLLMGCSNSATVEELNNVKVELDEAKRSIEMLETQIEEEGDLIHMVFKKTKPGFDQDALIAEMKSLTKIEGLKDFQIGPFENLGDERALKGYDMVMEMSFDDIDGYNTYQKHPIHLALKEKLAAYLAGPPATYDYIKK